VPAWQPTIPKKRKKEEEEWGEEKVKEKERGEGETKASGQINQDFLSFSPMPLPSLCRMLKLATQCNFHLLNMFQCLRQKRSDLQLKIP
jgi:hypothetical protein